MAETSNDSIKMKYALHDSEAYIMSAHVESETTASSLRAMNYISKALRIRTEIDTTSLHKGSIERFFRITITEKDENDLLLNIFMFVYQRVFYHNCTITLDDIVNNIEIGKRDKVLSILKRRNINDDTFSLIYNNNGLKKNRNTFYKTLDGYKKMDSISIYNGRNFDFSNNEKSLEVKAENFKKYISDISPELIEKDNAKIYLEAPVVVEDDQLKWIGVYNNKRIRFKMDSAEFKVKSQNGDIPYKNGLYINCKLEYKEFRDEDDNPTYSDYKIKDVYGFGVEDNYVLTLAGRKKEIEDNMPSLFSDEHFK